MEEKGLGLGLGVGPYGGWAWETGFPHVSLHGFPISKT